MKIYDQKPRLNGVNFQQPKCKEGFSVSLMKALCCDIKVSRFIKQESWGHSRLYPLRETGVLGQSSDKGQAGLDVQEHYIKTPSMRNFTLIT